MPTILAIDTATEACSVALLYQNQIDTCFEVIPQQHSQMILPMVEQLLNKRTLQLKYCDAIAFGVGPGSFTGLRIAASVAQGLAFAYQKPLIAISDLAALAYEAFEQYPNATFCVAALDARMHEVYVGGYQKQNNRIIVAVEDCLEKPAAALSHMQDKLKNTSWVAIGSGWENYTAIVEQAHQNPPLAIIHDAYPNAAAIVALAKVAFEEGRFLSCEEAQPHYIRDQVVHQKA